MGPVRSGDTAGVTFDIGERAHVVQLAIGCGVGALVILQLALQLLQRAALVLLALFLLLARGRLLATLALVRLQPDAVGRLVDAVANDNRGKAPRTMAPSATS